MSQTTAMSNYRTGKIGNGNVSGRPDAGHLLTDARIGFVDTLFLLVMWLLIIAASVESLGYAPGIIFLVLNAVLVARQPVNSVLVLLLLLLTPASPALLIPHTFAISAAIGLLGYFLHGTFLRYRSHLLNKTVLTATALVLYMGATVGLSDSSSTAIDYYLKYLEGLLALILVMLLINTREDLGRVLRWWCIITALSLIVTCIHVSLGTKTFWFLHMSKVQMGGSRAPEKLVVEIGGRLVSRLLVIGTDSNYWSAVLMFGFAVGLAFCSIAKVGKSLFWIIATGMIGISIVGTYSRSGFLAMAWVLALYLLKKKLRAIIPISIFGIAGIVLGKAMPDLVTRTAGIDRAVSAGATGRFALWGKALNMFAQSPIWGSGMGAFTEKFNYAAHNTFLQVAAECGLIGLGLYVMIIVFTITTCLKGRLSTDKSDSTFSLVILFGLLGMCVMLNTLTLEDPKLFWMECGICLLMSSVGRRREEKNQSTENGPLNV